MKQTLLAVVFVLLAARTALVDERAAAIAKAQQEAALIDLLEQLREAGFGIQALAERGSDVQPLVAHVVARLGDSEPEVRSTAADALGDAGPAARAAVPALRERLGDPDPAVRVAAASALVAIGAASGDVLPVLGEGIRRNDVRAIRAAGRIGPAAAGLLDDLLKRADVAPSVDHLRWIREAVERIDASRLPVLEAAVGAARRERAERLVRDLADMRTAWPAHQGLMALGEAAVPFLIGLLGEEVDASLPRATMVGPQIGPQGMGVAAFGAGDLADMPRWHAAGIVGEIGPVASDAVPVLGRIAVDPRESAAVRVAAIRSLGRIHSRPEIAVPALIAALDDGTLVPNVVRPAGIMTGAATIRGMAAEALGLFGQAAVSAAPALRHAESEEASPAMVASIREARDRIRQPTAEQLEALAETRESTVVDGRKHFRDAVHGLEFDYPARYRAKEGRVPDGTLGTVGLLDGDRPVWDASLDIEQPDGFTSLEGTSLDFGVRRALLHCSADGPHSSVSCTGVRSQRPLRTRAGLKAVEATLLEEEDRGGVKTRRDRTVFVVDVSTRAGIRVLLLTPGGDREPADVDMLREIALSVGLAAPSAIP